MQNKLLGMNKRSADHHKHVQVHAVGAVSTLGKTVTRVMRVYIELGLKQLQELFLDLFSSGRSTGSNLSAH